MGSKRRAARVPPSLHGDGHLRLLVLPVVAVLVAALLIFGGCPGRVTGSNQASYRDDVRIIMRGACRCHVDNSTPPGKLDLTTYASLMQGSTSGRQVVPMLPESSNLYRRVSRGEMPPTSPLAPEDVRIIRRWIEQGAKDN